MNQKGPAYLLILVFLISTGAAISCPGEKSGHLSKANSIPADAPAKVLPDYSVYEEACNQNFQNTETDFPATPIETIFNNFPQNYFLSTEPDSEKEEIRRTNYWFTSQLRT